MENPQSIRAIWSSKGWTASSPNRHLVERALPLRRSNLELIIMMSVCIFLDCMAQDTAQE